MLLNGINWIYCISNSMYRRWGMILFYSRHRRGSAESEVLGKLCWKKKQNPARHKAYALPLHSVLCSTCSPSERFALVLISQGAHDLRPDVECLLKVRRCTLHLCTILLTFSGTVCFILMDVIRLGLVSSIIWSSLELLHLLWWFEGLVQTFVPSIPDFIGYILLQVHFQH